MAALSSIIGITKAISGGLTKKKIMQGAGDALKDVAKKRIGRRKRGGPGAPGEDEGGSIIQSPSGSIVPTSPLMGDIVVPYPQEPAKVKDKPVAVVNFKTLSEQLQSIVALTSAIEKSTAQSIKSKKKINETNRRNKEKAAKRAKEKKREGGSGILGFIGQKTGEVAQASGIMGFLGNILAGFIAVNLLPLIPRILEGMNFVGVNLHYFFLGFRGLGQAFKLGSKKFKKIMPKVLENLKEIGKPVKEIFKNAGRRIKNVFKSLSKLVPGFITRGLDAIGDAARAVGEGVKRLGQGAGKLGQKLGRVATLNTRSQQLGASAGNLQKLTGQTGRGTQQVLTQSLRMRRLHGDEAARMYKGLVDNGMSNAKASKYVMNQIKAGKLTSAPLKGTLAGGIKGSQVFKGGPLKVGKRAIIKLLGPSKAVKTALRNIPVVGPLIVAITSLLSGEPVAQALFKTGGTFIGGLLGLAIPIPILGPIIGEIIGEYVGDLAYVALMGGGVDALAQRLKQDITNVMSAGETAMKWVGDGFGRFIEGIPKMSVLGLGEIPNPVWMMNPLNIVEKMGLFWKSFFTRDPMSKGENKGKDGITNKSDVRRDTKGARAGDFIVASDGSVGVFDGMGTRGLRPGEQELFDSGASNIDGTMPSSTESKKMMSETDFYNAKVEDHGLPDTYEEYKALFSEAKTPLIPGANTSTGEAMATGLRTGASQYIGGSADYHIDTQIMKSVPMEQKVAMVDQMAAGYAKQGRVMEFSNQGVAGEIWDTNMSYDEKVKLLERAFAAHSHSSYGDRNSIDYYIPKKGDSRFDKSAEGAEILAPTVGGSTATYASGGGYGNFIEIKDEKGNVIARTGHGDTRFGPKSGTVDIGQGVTPQPETQQPEMTPQKPPTSTPQSVQRQTSYEKPSGGQPAPIILPPKTTPQMPSGGRSNIVPVGSGDVLNSYYKSQLLGFLYKQG